MKSLNPEDLIYTIEEFKSRRKRLIDGIKKGRAIDWTLFINIKNESETSGMWKLGYFPDKPEIVFTIGLSNIYGREGIEKIATFAQQYMFGELPLFKANEIEEELAISMTFLIKPRVIICNLCGSIAEPVFLMIREKEKRTLFGSSEKSLACKQCSHRLKSVGWEIYRAYDISFSYSFSPPYLPCNLCAKNLYDDAEHVMTITERRKIFFNMLFFDFPSKRIVCNQCEKDLLSQGWQETSCWSHVTATPPWQRKKCSIPLWLRKNLKRLL